MNTKFFLSTILMIGLFSFFSCQKDSDILPLDPDEITEVGEEENRELMEGERAVRIRLTDGPADLQAVNVDIIGLYIVADSNKYQLTTVNGVYNLLDFQNGIDTLISVDTFNSSFLKDIVLELGDNNSVVDDQGIEFPLELPSANRDFLKIKFNQKLDSLQLLDVQLDFDACRSVRETGNGRWILKPVIHVSKVNNRPMDVDPDISDKIAMIEAAYPAFDEFRIERHEYCFMNEVVIRVDAKSVQSGDEMSTILNTDCEELYTISQDEVDNLSVDLLEAAQSSLNGNAELFVTADIFTDSNGEVFYGFALVRGNGNGAKQFLSYVDADATLICTE